MIRAALTIAGSDPSGGAGIQADLKTFHQHRVYGMAALTLLTVQNTLGVNAVYCVKPKRVAEQIEAVLSDIKPRAIKTGALGNAEVIRAVADSLRLSKIPLVIDPVMISKHGAPLLAKEAVKVFCRELLPLAALVTPNVYEAEAITGMVVRDIKSMTQAAEKICLMGAKAALIKGGHLKGDAVDLFYQKGQRLILRAKRIIIKHTHGTGCTYSAAITANLANGEDVLSAVKNAKRFIAHAIKTSPKIGKGVGPVNHFA